MKILRGMFVSILAAVAERKLYKEEGFCQDRLKKDLSSTTI
jgi:hypothetical protein